MSNNKLLKFPSQRQLVDRLLHLIEFNHPFIFLSGKLGSGRGTLCESLLGNLPEKVRVVSLIGSAAMKMADVRQLLLPQVVNTIAPVDGKAVKMGWDGTNYGFRTDAAYTGNELAQGTECKMTRP